VELEGGRVLRGKKIGMLYKVGESPCGRDDHQIEALVDKTWKAERLDDLPQDSKSILRCL
jgi:hypothetical protein